MNRQERESPPDSDAVYVNPSELTINADELKKILVPFKKGRSTLAEREAAAEIIIKHKILPRLPTKSGPKTLSPQDRMRELRQNYLWLIRELLASPETKTNQTDKDVCLAATRTIHGFTDYCSHGIFLNHWDFNRISSYNTKIALAGLPQEQREFMKGVTDKKKRKTTKQIDWRDLAKTSEIKKSEQAPAPSQEKAKITTGKVDLIGKVIATDLADAVGLNALSFLVLQPERLRATRSGRPSVNQKFDYDTLSEYEQFASTYHQKKEVPTLADKATKIGKKVTANKINPKEPTKVEDLSTIVARLSSMYNGPYKKSAPNCHQKKEVTVRGKQDPKIENKIKQKLPTEVEVLRKVVARLCLIKNLINSRPYFFTISEEQVTFISCYQAGNYGPSAGPISEVCDTLLRNGNQQIPTPWTPSNEMAGCYDAVLPMGVLEAKI